MGNQVISSENLDLISRFKNEGKDYFRTPQTFQEWRSHNKQEIERNNPIGVRQSWMEFLQSKRY